MLVNIFNTGNSKYYFNLDKYVSFFCDLKTSEKEKNAIITMTYGDNSNEYETDKDLTLLTKEVVESKVNTNSQTQSLRYETLKMFVDRLFDTYFDKEGNVLDSYSEPTMQQKLAFNTLVKAGILVREENNSSNP